MWIGGAKAEIFTFLGKVWYRRLLGMEIIVLEPNINFIALNFLSIEQFLSPSVGFDWAWKWKRCQWFKNNGNQGFTLLTFLSEILDWRSDFPIITIVYHSELFICYMTLRQPGWRRLGNRGEKTLDRKQHICWHIGYFCQEYNYEWNKRVGWRCYKCSTLSFFAMIVKYLYKKCMTQFDDSPFLNMIVKLINMNIFCITCFPEFWKKLTE